MPSILDRYDSLKRRRPPVDLTPSENAFGYPVVDPAKYQGDKQGGLMDYLKQNPRVAGMAMGRGLNGTEDLAPRSIIVNPFNQGMKDPERRKGLLMNEATRHMMEDEKYTPKFAITPKMQAWRQRTFRPDEPYSTDDDAFRKTLVARAVVGDIGNEHVTPEVEADAARFRNALNTRQEGKGSSTTSSLLDRYDSLKRRRMAVPMALSPGRPGSLMAGPVEDQRVRVFPTRHPNIPSVTGEKDKQSNVVMAGVNIGGLEYVIPTVVEGKVLAIRDAVDLARKHGLHKYPTFKTPDEATRFAEEYHDQIDEEGYLRRKQKPR